MYKRDGLGFWASHVFSKKTSRKLAAFPFGYIALFVRRSLREDRENSIFPKGKTYLLTHPKQSQAYNFFRFKYAFFQIQKKLFRSRLIRQ